MGPCRQGDLFMNTAACRDGQDLVGVQRLGRIFNAHYAPLEFEAIGIRSRKFRSDVQGIEPVDPESVCSKRSCNIIDVTGNCNCLCLCSNCSIRLP